MTEKELLYLEDILEHSKQLVDVCNNLGSNAGDSLKEELSNVIDVTSDSYTKIYNLL